jgi:hypothetical protein
MKYIAKALIAMLICMAALIGTALAWNPGSLHITECEQYGQIEPLQTDINPESATLVNPDVGEIFVDADGAYAFFVNPNLEFVTKTTMNFLDIYGNGHQVSVTVFPCAVEVPTCEYRFSDFDDNIQIGTPTIGQTVPVSWSAPGGNGDWSLRIYEAGVLNRGKWTGNYPIEVVATELDENWVPTGFQIIDGICEM